MGGTKGAHCAAPSCCNYRKTCPDLSFFRFPSEKKRCFKWIINTRRRDLEMTYFQLQSKQYFSSNFVLCSDHFTDCCFMNSRRNKLVHDAIPSLFTITASNFQLPYVDLLSEEYSAKRFKNKTADEDMASVLEESRHVDLVIGKKLKEAHQQGQLDVNICFPHEHGSGVLKPSNPETALASTRKKSNSHDTITTTTTSKLLVRKNIIKPVHAPVGTSMKAHTKVNCRSKKSNTNIKQKAKGVTRAKNSTTANIENVSCQAPSICPYYLCCSKDCLSTSITNLLFPFPANIQQAKVWLERCGRPELKGLLDSHGSVPHNFMLCDKHFKRSQFASFEKDNKTLQTNAMPTLFSFDSVKRKAYVRRRQIDSTTGSIGSSLQSHFGEHDSSSALSPLRPVCGAEVQARLGQDPAHLTDTRQRERHLALLASRTGSSRSNSDGSLTNGDGGGGVCSYNPCKRRRGPLYKFPQDPSRCLAWLQNTGYSNLPPALLSSSEDVSTASFRLCHRHFEPSCFFIINNTTKLLSYAVPTVFDHSSVVYPCQHKSLAERYRRCPHDQCHQLIQSGVYDSGVDDPDNYVDTKQALQWHETALSSGPYIICDQSTIYGEGRDEDQGGEGAEEDLTFSDEEECREPGKDRPTKKMKLDQAYTMHVPPMEFDDADMPEEEKVAIMSAELEHLKHQSRLLTHHLGRQRGARFRYKRALQVLSFARPLEFTEEHALHYLKQALSKSTYEFFLCQRKHRKFPPWNFDSLQIPTIANRCGLGVRETLFEIFRMPTIRTFSRYRKMLRKDPSLVSDENLLKNDLRRAYHRKLQRKRRPQHLEPATISTIIKKFIVKNEEIQSSGGTGRCHGHKAVSETLSTVADNVDDSLYHHKKYNSPQKPQFVGYEETVAV